MRFGIWDHFERQPGVAVPAQYQAKLELLQAAEGLGFVGYHLAEHHLSSLDLAPSPSVFLAALAAVTRTLRLGAMVYILPLYQPTRLVQELAMLDNLSAGRLDLGIGRGIRAAEHEWFGLDATDARAHHDEMLAFLVQAFTTGELEFAGRFVRLPAARLDLLPVQRPYPPLWYAGGVDTPLGIGSMSWRGPPTTWRTTGRCATRRSASADADGISTSAAPLNPQIAQRWRASPARCRPAHRRGGHRRRSPGLAGLSAQLASHAAAAARRPGRPRRRLVRHGVGPGYPAARGDAGDDGRVPARGSGAAGRPHRPSTSRPRSSGAISPRPRAWSR